MNAEQLDAKRRAEAQANIDCARGLADLERQIVTAPEYTVGDSPSRTRILTPKRAELVGMHAHLVEAIERQRQRDDR